MSLIKPVPGKPVTQGFEGHNTNEPPGKLNTGGLSSRLITPRRTYDPPLYRHLHGAQDISCPIGTPILAPEAGIIVQLGTIARFSDGSIDGEHYTLLQIHRDATSQTILLFTHLSGWVAKVGARVKKGQVIAKSGNSGRSTGPHLHWQVCTGLRTLSPGAVVWGLAGTRWDPKECFAGGELATRSFLKPNV